jgi:hypothetical protein
MAFAFRSDFSRLLWLIPASALLLVAADPPWKTKPISQWTEEDAKLVLADSPWSKTITAGIARRQTEDERREGGNMGQQTGVGYDNVDKKGSGPKMPTTLGDLFTAPRSARSFPQATTMLVRWEHALPVQVAELKTGFVEPPTLPGDGYRISVYGVPKAEVKGDDPAKLGEPFKNDAFLKRFGKPDVKPTRVEVFQVENGFVVCYLFPLSAEITLRDEHVEFDAQIGRIVIYHSFDLATMQYNGKLEL